MSLNEAVVVVAGAGGGAGAAVVRRLSSAGAIIVTADQSLDSTEPLVREIGEAGGQIDAYALDLLDEDTTRKWADSVTSRFGRVDGVVHLVGGWRGGKGITEADLADWDWLSGLLVRTVQNTTRAFHDQLKASPRGQFVLVSAAEASRPTAKNASYAAAKAAAEAWTLAVADSFRGSQAAATIVVVKALVTPAMREAKPDAAFKGYTDVVELADTIASLWDKTAEDVNGERLWLTT
ncbi:MAG TPA: SDR family oxidoreductase [Acidothermaceae bacterium]|nr:SDR family oxidoreductase [Acidothermaceae bacterium]